VEIKQYSGIGVATMNKASETSARHFDVKCSRPVFDTRVENAPPEGWLVDDHGPFLFARPRFNGVVGDSEY
jgi:hypothetical protein